MIQKGKIEKVIDRYTYKVRIPKYDKIQEDSSGIDTEDLSDSLVCTTPGVNVSYALGDIVIVAFENDEISKPIILGLLYREDSNNINSDTSLLGVDENIQNIESEISTLKKSSNIYTHLKYSNDNGITFTSLYNPNMYERTDSYGNIYCSPAYSSRSIQGIKLDKKSKIITWFIADENNNNVTNQIGIETTLFDSNGDIVRIIPREENNYSIILNNLSQVEDDLYITYKIYATKDYLDRLHITLSTDKNTLGTQEGSYLGIYVSDNKIPSLDPSDYKWFSFAAGGMSNDVLEVISELEEATGEIKEQMSEVTTDVNGFRISVAEAVTTSQRAEDTAQSVREAADRGDFDGTSIIKIEEEYRLSTSDSSLLPADSPTPSIERYVWNTTQPEYVYGEYYWVRQHIYYDNETSDYSDAVCDKSINGAINHVETHYLSTASFDVAKDQIQSRVAKTEVELIGQYALCQTENDTSAKVATIVPTVQDWQLENEKEITVQFQYGNNTSNPTLNINSTGAKSIIDTSGNVFSEWDAGSVFLFKYNGTEWVVQENLKLERLDKAESAITQNAREIELKVSDSDLTGNNIIGRINLNTDPEGSNAIISADRVNINGAAIFTSGRLSETNLNNTYSYKSNTIVESQRIYYQSSISDIDDIPEPSGWIVYDPNASLYDNWLPMRVSYSTNYKYTFTCDQFKFDNGDITHSTILRDNTTTVIDGGNIITNSIVAQKLNITEYMTFGSKKRIINGTYIATNDTSPVFDKQYFLKETINGIEVYTPQILQLTDDPHELELYEIIQNKPGDWNSNYTKYWYADVQHQDNYINVTFNTWQGDYFLSEDDFADTNKIYYTLISGEYIPVENPQGYSPRVKGWYELQNKVFYEDNIYDPQIVIGRKDAFAVTIDSGQLTFWYDYTPVAYLNGEQMVIPRSVMLEEMKIGNKLWSWRNHGDNLCLKWLGEKQLGD